MKPRSNFIPYDDNNIEHTSNGPDYGQINSGSKETAWIELDSKEYYDYVSEIILEITKHPFLRIA